MSKIPELLHQLATEFEFEQTNTETKIMMLEDKIDKQNKDMEIIKKGLQYILYQLEENLNENSKE